MKLETFILLAGAAILAYIAYQAYASNRTESGVASATTNILKLQ